MTVKELFLQLDFYSIYETLLKRPYKDSLLTMHEYKENYDTLCNRNYNDSKGTITFRSDGDSDAYMIEGDSFENIVGMDVILPDNREATKLEAAAEILWCSGPFGNWTAEDWKALEEELLKDSQEISPI